MSPPSRASDRSRPPLGRLVRERLDRATPASLVAAVVAVGAGVAVFALATTVFRYHSSNHDEAVYLFQAAMLLEGTLEVYAGDLAGAVRPWFFVEDDGRLYSKYSPVPAAMYAVSMALFGEPRVTLAVVAAGNVALVYALGATAFDRRVGALAAVLFAASPLALVTTSVFLPYAPTTLLNLGFAVAYLRNLRDGSTVAAAVAGVAIGLAFFARPYTAVLFAAPFIVHACSRVGTALRDRGVRPLPAPVLDHGVTALLGALFVGVTLAYNARLTGSPLRFPYEAFAPLDGPGFGYREILSHSVDYTPALALRANGYVLWYFATRWFTAGPIGTALAAGGLVLCGRRWRRGDAVLGAAGGAGRSLESTAGQLLAGLFVTVPLGNLLFWGNLNVLGTLSDPTDGILSQFGPFYHFDLLVPLSVFAAVAALACWDRGRPALRSRLEGSLHARPARAAVVVLLVVALLAVGTAGAAVVAAPLERNAAYTEQYDRAYEPIETTDFDDALVFVPTPYGDWQHHPFQYLRNDPGFDGEVVYALDRTPAEDFAVLDAYPDRTHYRYAYQGEWTPDPDPGLTPKLEPLSVERGDPVRAETVVGVPEFVDRASVRVETGDGDHASYAVEAPGESLSVPWSVDGDGVRLDDADAPPVAIDGTDRVVLTVTLVQPDGSTLTYRQAATVRATDDGVEVVWPPERRVCTLVTDCGSAGTYLPDEPGATPGGTFETRIVDATA